MSDKQKHDTIFHKIIDKEIKSNILFENKKIIAIYDINPKTPGHFLVIPKKFSRNLITIKEKEMNYLFKITRKLAIKEMRLRGVSGFKIISNNEASAGQEVFYTHIHVIPSKE